MVPDAAVAPGQLHPTEDDLERLMRGALPRTEACVVVRHLLQGCAQCAAVTGWLWRVGEEPPRDPRAEEEKGRQ